MRRSSLRKKLLQIMLGVLLIVGVGNLLLAAWTNYRAAQRQLSALERQIDQGIRSRTDVLTASHALALRALAADNALSDVHKLVTDKVTNEKDIVYGVFLDPSGRPWAYASPSTEGVSLEQLPHLNPVAELGLSPSALTQKEPSSRSLKLFQEQVYEVAYPVVDQGQLLGSIRYGVSTASLRAALEDAREAAAATQRESILWICLIALANLLLGSLLINRAARRITDPLSDFTRAAKRIAEGNSDVRVEVRTNDELEELAEAFNQMQAANEDAFEKLKETTRQALEASRLKGEFLANMSHEIRTPMNGIIGMIRLILNMDLHSKLRRYAETVDASASALLTIINDILDFSKMEAGKYSLQRMEFDPTVVVGEVVELFAGRAFEKQVELVCRTEPNIPANLIGDPDRFRQILTNLVGNAVKFTDRGEIYVELALDQTNDKDVTLRALVQDSGIGIEESDIPQLFDAFSQADGSSVRRFGGTGLGLSISKRLVELMGGKIGVSSERGIGSKFWFTVKLELGDETKRESEPCPAGKRALVVEPNRRWSSIIAEHMRAWGVECRPYERGDEALAEVQALEDETFDAVVVGARLNDMSIERFVTELRAIPATSKTPLIVLTRLGTVSPLQQIEDQIAAQLTKPLRLSELYECLLTSFGRSPTRVRALKRRQRAVTKGRSLRVLVVDDNEVNQYVAAEQLQEAGYAVDIAANGAEAVRMVQETAYTAVLMDCQMPVMDGYTATREIRDFEGDSKHTLIIALTAHAMIGERDKVLAAGMDDYLSKPLTPSKLERTLNRHVRTDLLSDPPGAPSLLPPDPDDAFLDPATSRSPRLIDIFLRMLPSHVDELKTEITRGSATEARAKAHKIKGSCLAIGAFRMARVAEKLQKLAEDNQLSKAEALLIKLNSEFEELSVALQKELDKGGHKRINSQRPS